MQKYLKIFMVAELFILVPPGGVVGWGSEGVVGENVGTSVNKFW